MFKKFQLICFDTAGSKKTKARNIYVIQIVLCVLLIVGLLAGMGITLVYSAHIRDELALLESSYAAHASDEKITRYTTSALNSVVSALYTDDQFVKEIFDVPIIKANYEYDSFIANYTESTIFLNLLIVNSRSGFQNMVAVNRFVNMLRMELDIRMAKYEHLREYLEKQYVIFRHTPSIWPSATPRVTSEFGFRNSPFTGVPSYHEGTDFSAITGTNIMAAADGIVVFAGPRTSYGNIVTIDHGFGYMTRYAHNSRLLVKAGDKVKKGDVISLSGATGRSDGPHLHYEVLYNGTPINPKKFIPGYF